MSSDGRRYVEVGPRSFNVRWMAIFSGILGGIVLTWFEALIGVFQALSLAVETIAVSVQQRTVRMIEAVFAATGIMEEAWAAAAADLIGTGIFAFAIGILIAGVVWALYSLGVTWLVD